jgi:hypothetical protein
MLLQWQQAIPDMQERDWAQGLGMKVRVSRASAKIGNLGDPWLPAEQVPPPKEGWRTVGESECRDTT